MISVEATIKGAKGAVTGLMKAKERMLKAQNTAVRVEGFRLMRQLREEIKAGAPGGQRFAPLSIIQRTMMGIYKRWDEVGNLRANNPLYRFGSRIGYEVLDKSPYVLKIGFVGPASSSTWRKMAQKHQRGFTTSADAPYFRRTRRNVTIRELFAREGAKVNYKIYGGAKTLRRKVFFLRASTTTLRTPARPMIDPFWRANRAEALRNILDNTRRKMRGEYI